ncbi:MAG: hypothetical protein JWM32_682 [Verrucomicrobia bacterium]|nr:hypothetical protein [Verrucomicrobiota bacterium]
MKNPTKRDVRNAVILAVVTTAIAMLALLDPSCHPLHKPAGVSRSIAP